MNLSKKAIWIIIVSCVDLLLIGTGIWNIVKTGEKLMGAIELGVAAGVLGVIIWLALRKWK